MRTTDMRYPTINDNSNLRFNSHIQFLPQQHNQTQNIYYPTSVAIPISPQLPNGPNLNNYSLFSPIYQIPPNHQQMISGNQQLLISMPNTNSNLSDNTSLGTVSTVESNMNSFVTSPVTRTATQSRISVNYTVSKWHEISSLYDGNPDERPSAGKLKNGKYFAQRSAGKDIYMVFNSISDYINNFVNYYFSNKNFSTDEKLFNLMDSSGSVALKDLVKFPRLAHIGTKIDDVMEAVKHSSFAKIVKMQNDTKGIRRSDGWFPSKLIDDSHKPNVPQWTPMNGFQPFGMYPKKSEPANEIQGINKVVLSKSAMPGIFGSNPSGQILDTSNVVSPNSHYTADIINAPLIDNGMAQNSLIYFNPSNSAIPQPIYPSPPTFMTGILQNYPIQTMAAPGGHLIAPPNPSAHQFVLHPSQHYPTFYPQTNSQSFQMRPFWPNHNIQDLTVNPVLYTSTNNANLRHVIGAGGGNNVNNNLR